jgi:Trk K+ transport system NAD-binding subunit
MKRLNIMARKDGVVIPGGSDVLAAGDTIVLTYDEEDVRVTMGDIETTERGAVLR